MFVQIMTSIDKIETECQILDLYVYIGVLRIFLACDKRILIKRYDSIKIKEQHCFS